MEPLPTKKSTEELIEDVVTTLYHDGVFVYTSMKHIAIGKGYTVTDNQCYAVLRRLKIEEFIDTTYWGRDELETTERVQELKITLSADGRKKMLKYKSYANYIKHQKKISRNENIEKNIKNGNIIASVLISAVAVILTQCPIGNKKQQQKIEQGIESLAKQLDSLKQELHNKPTQLSNPTSSDIATKKD